MSKDIPHDMDIHRYHGPQQPAMPPEEAFSVLPLKAPAHKALKRRALETDFRFLHIETGSLKCSCNLEACML